MENKDKRRERYSKNPQPSRDYSRIYRLNNKEKVTQQVNKRVKKYNKLKREKIILKYTNGKLQCNCCNVTGIEFLCIDHINNDGNKQRKEFKSISSFYSWIIKNNYPDTLQILCWNCNSAKQIYGICPHKVINTYILTT